MVPNPVEVANHQSSRDFRLFPDLTKLVLLSMPFSRLLPNNAIGAFESLCFVLADVMLHLMRQNSLIPTPIVTVEVLTICLSLSVAHQLFNQSIGVFGDSYSQNQATGVG